MVALSALMLALLVSFVASSTFWLVLALAFNFQNTARFWILGVALTFALFGFQVLFDIGGGLAHIWSVATLAAINQVVNVFTFGAIFALAGIITAIIASLAVLVVRIFED